MSFRPSSHLAGVHCNLNFRDIACGLTVPNQGAVLDLWSDYVIVCLFVDVVRMYVQVALGES